MIGEFITKRSGNMAGNETGNSSRDAEGSKIGSIDGVFVEAEQVDVGEVAPDLVREVIAVDEV
jgi:hypothetical protein